MQRSAVHSAVHFHWPMLTSHCIDFRLRPARGYKHITLHTVREARNRECLFNLFPEYSLCAHDLAPPSP